MKNNTPLYILLFFLIIVNVFFLYNYLGKPDIKRANTSNGNMDFIAKQLKFDTNQLQEMKNINNRHHQNMVRLNNATKELKDALFNNLSDAPLDKKVIDSITSLIGQKEKELNTEVFYHFRSIKELCTEEQKETFKNIINDALRKGDNQRPPRKGEDQNGPPPNRGERPGPPPNH